MSETLSGYELSRAWFDFAFENPEKIKPIHSALYFFAIEHCNRLGWKRKFGLPSQMTKEAIGVKSHNTYMGAFRDLSDWGFIDVIQLSKNQYSANIIALSKYNKALDKALDKAFIKHGTKQSESTVQSIDNINKPINNKPINKETIEVRKGNFRNSLKQYLEKYSKEMLKEFFEYWTEHGDNDKKMRFEKETSYSISRRLSTWYKNDFSNNTKGKEILANRRDRQKIL